MKFFKQFLFFKACIFRYFICFIFILVNAFAEDYNKNISFSKPIPETTKEQDVQTLNSNFNQEPKTETKTELKEESKQEPKIETKEEPKEESKKTPGKLLEQDEKYENNIFQYFLQNKVKNAVEIKNHILKYAKQFNVNPLLVVAIIDQESNFKQASLSKAGAVGIMQLMPDTAKELNVDPYDLEDNIKGGTQYISEMLRIHENNIPLALASYNAGLGNVKKYGGIPPFEETETYVKLVTDTFNFLTENALNDTNTDYYINRNLSFTTEVNEDMKDKDIAVKNKDEYESQSNIIYFSQNQDTKAYKSIRYYHQDSIKKEGQ